MEPRKLCEQQNQHSQCQLSKYGRCTAFYHYSVSVLTVLSYLSLRFVGRSLGLPSNQYLWLGSSLVAHLIISQSCGETAHVQERTARSWCLLPSYLHYSYEV